jgi:hypothetical protein
LILVFAVHLAAHTAALEHTEKCAIEGVVVAAATGAPLADAEVSISRDAASEPPLVATTDAAGHYAVNGLEPGRYSVTVERSRYLRRMFGQHGKNIQGVPLILAPGEKLHDINFALLRIGVIAGRVLGEDNDPRVAAEVQAFTTRYVRGQRLFAVAGKATTNDLGGYRIYGLEPGRYYVSVREEEHYRTLRQPEGAPPETQYVPTMYPSATDFNQATIVDVRPGGEVRGIDITAVKSLIFHIRGKVPGVPNPYDTFVQLKPIGIEREIWARDKRLDGQGKFELDGVTSGSYVISVYGNSDYAWRTIEIGNADVDDVTLAPGTGIQLQGRVRVEGDKGIQLKQLHAGLWNPYSPSEPMVPVSSDGSFVLRDVQPYAYRFGMTGLPEDFYLKSVRLGDQRVAGTTIDLGNAEGAPGVLEIVVSGTAGAIDGMARNDKDEPASGAVVVLVPDLNHRQESDLFKDVTTDQNGHFTLRGIRPGDYKLFAWDDVEPGIWWDPEFLSHYETKGKSVKVEAGGHLSVNLHLISTNPE